MKSINFFSFERYIRICFYCQLKETSILTDENIKYYKVFVIIFPILFYIPKFFEVHSHYETVDVHSSLDCGKYMHLGKLLNSSHLRDHIIRSIKEDELATIDNLATACKSIIDEERDQMQNISITNRKVSDRIPQNPIKEQVSSMNGIDKTFPPLNSTNATMKLTTQRETKDNYTRRRRDENTPQKVQKPARKLPYTSIWRYILMHKVIFYIDWP